MTTCSSCGKNGIIAGFSGFSKSQLKKVKVGVGARCRICIIGNQPSTRESVTQTSSPVPSTTSECVNLKNDNGKKRTADSLVGDGEDDSEISLSELSNPSRKKIKSRPSTNSDAGDVSSLSVENVSSLPAENKSGSGCLGNVPSTPPTPSATSPRPQTLLSKLAAFYGRACPEKKDRVQLHENLVRKFENREADLWQMLSRKYPSHLAASGATVVNKEGGEPKSILKKGGAETESDRSVDSSHVSSNSAKRDSKGLLKGVGASKPKGVLKTKKTVKNASPAQCGDASALPAACSMASGGIPSSAAAASPRAQLKTGVAASALVCDKCDGAHATASCPHFKKGRDKHPDAQQRRLALTSMGGDGGGNVFVRNSKVVSQPGDGSCLFHSLAFGLKRLGLLQQGSGGGGGGSRQGANQLRRDIATFVAKNSHVKISDTPLASWVKWDSGLGLAQYCQRMRRGSGWGGGIELAGCALLYKVNVHVYERVRVKSNGDGSSRSAVKRISCFGGASAGSGGGKNGVVHVLYQGGVHYDALVVQPGDVIKGPDTPSLQHTPQHQNRQQQQQESIGANRFGAQKHRLGKKRKWDTSPERPTKKTPFNHQSHGKGAGRSGKGQFRGRSKW